MSEGDPILTNETADLSSQDLYISFVLYSGIFVVIFVLFLVLRRIDLFYFRVFYPIYPHEKYISEYDREKRKGRVVPPKKNSCFGWFLYLLSPQRDNDILEEAGLDAYATIRVARIPLFFFFFWSVFGGFILLPLFGSRRANESPLQAVSLANVVDDDVATLRFAFVSLLFSVIIVLALMKFEFENFIKVRKKFLSRKAKEGYSIVVERVPSKLVSKALLTQYFETLVGDVASVDFVPKTKLTSPVQKLINQRKAVLINLEKAKAFYEKKSTQKKVTTFDLDVDERLEEINSLAIDETEPVATNSAKFETLVNLVKLELKGHSSAAKWMVTLSCGLLKGMAVSQGNAKEVDANEYFQKKLEILNKLISWSQYRIEVLTDSVHVGDSEGTFFEGDLPFSNFVDARYVMTPALSKEEGAQLLEEGADDSEKKTVFKTMKNFLLGEEKMKGDFKANKELLANVATTVIVTFKTKSAANIAGSISLNEIRDRMRTSVAKKPDDLVPANFGASSLLKTMVGFFTFFFIATLIIFFGSFVSFLAVITSLENIRQNSEVLDEFLDDNPFLVDLFEQVAPFILVFALALVPPIMMVVFNLSKPISISSKQVSFLFAYYIFMVVQLFLVYTIAQSSAAVNFNETVADPLSIIDTLGEAIPTSSVFFMQFIMIKTLLSLPLEFSRLVPIILGIVLRCCCTCQPYAQETEREKDSTKCLISSPIQQPNVPPLASINAQAMLIYTIAISYSILAPLIAPIALGYCLMFTFVWRNQFLFVYAQSLRKVDSLGSQFKTLMNTFIIALLLLTATMIGYFALTASELPGISAISLPLLVVIYLVKEYFDRVYGEDLNTLPLSLAKEYDIETTDESVEEKEALLEKRKKSGRFLDYRHPVLKAPSVLQL